MKTLILSDLHLGSKHCNGRQIAHTLDRLPFDRLILNGDTIHNLNLRKLKAEHWAVVDRLRRIGKQRELVLLRGNHDHDHYPGENGDGFGGHSVLPALLETAMGEEYRLEAGGRSYLILHGDQFDPTLHFPLMTDMAGWCYQFSKKMNKKLAKWLKKKSRKWGGLLNLVREKSVAYAREQGSEGVITGHTHYAEDSQVDDVHYLNTGCWTEAPCTYATLESSRLELHYLAE